LIIFLNFSNFFLNLKLNLERINDCLRTITDWGANTGLCFNPTKSQLMLFGVLPDTPPEIQMNGEKINYSETIKYLGVIISRNLKWNDHIDYAIEKAKQLEITARSFMAKTFGICPTVRRIISKAIVESRLLYGAPVWSKKLTQANLKKIISVQENFAVRVISGFSKTCGKRAKILANMIPIEYLIQLRTSLFKLSYYGKSNGLRLNKHPVKWYLESELDTMERKKNVEFLKRQLKEMYIKQARSDLKEKDKDIFLSVTSLISENELYDCRNVLKLVDFFTTQHLTGRGLFGHMLKLMNKTDTDICKYCGEPNDTAGHRLYTCSGLEYERIQLLEPMINNSSHFMSNLLSNESDIAKYKAF
jgi:hypothetical protein